MQSVNYVIIKKILPMKRTICLFCFIFIVSISEAQYQNLNYDSTLAKQLGADDYGMKSFVFVLLKTGINSTTDKAGIDSCFSGHLKNITKLVEEKKLIVAGPFFKNDKSMRGLFILNTATIEEAKTILDTDPAIKAELLSAELYQWYGSAALTEYLQISDKIWKLKP